MLNSFHSFRCLAPLFLTLLGLSCASVPSSRAVAATSETPQALPSPQPSQSLQPLQVGVVQFPIREGATESAFLAEAEKYILEAKKGGSTLVVLPELLTLDMLSYGDLENEKRQIDRIAGEFFSIYVDFLKRLATREKISILGGSTPRRVGEKIRNTAIFVSQSGETLFQDKLFLTPDEVRWGWEGGTDLNVMKTPHGNWVILICYDSQFAELSALLHEVKPSLILIPSMTGDKGLNRVRFAAQARAIEHHAYVVVSGAVSAKSPKDLIYVGQNLVIPPQEKGFPELLAKGPKNAPATTAAVLDFQKLNASRSSAGIYSSRDYQQAIRAGQSFFVRSFERSIGSAETLGK